MSPAYETMDWADLGPATLQIQVLKKIERRTTLIGQDGAAGYLVVCPDSPDYRDLAYQLQEAIQGSLMGPLRVRTPRQLSDADKQHHLIALGNINNNPLLADLYHYYYAAVDHAYPGAGGHVAQTVYDPWGFGTNAIVCGGSDWNGVATAVQKVISQLERSADGVHLPRLHDITIGDSFRSRYPSVSFECTPDHHREMIAHAYERLAQGAHRGATPTVAHAGLMYHLTGDDRFAALYRDLFKILYQDAVNDPGTGPWSPWGFDADFQSAPMLGAWDVVEEAEIFTDRDRLYMTNHILSYVQYMAEHVQGHRPKTPRSSRHNHYTFAALGLLYGAKYFQKYYDHPEVSRWLDLADECFQVQAEAFKANEDCNSYQWLTFYHTFKYAVIRPDPTYLESGMARLCMDLGIATMDNLGYQVPYGDCQEYTGTFSEIPFYKATAWALQDPVYAPVLARKDMVRPEFSIDGLYPVGYEYAVDLGQGRDLTQFMGVARLPVDPLYFATFDGDAHIDYAKSFDKIVFRDAFDPNGDYLLVDGLSNGGHLHFDGNAIVRYTSKDRIWLADADYMKSATKFHNAVLVFRDGAGGLIPPYIEFGHAVALDGFGYSRSTARGYCDTDWTRHVLRVGKHFIVMDDVQANEAGDYDLRCVWRSVGDAALSEADRVFAVDQNGPRFEIHAAPGYAAPADLYFKHEPMIWGSWQHYPHHGRSADVKILQERASVRLDRGDQYAFWNLFGTDAPYPAIERLGEHLVRLEDGDTPALVGSGAALRAYQAGIESDAAFAYLSAQTVFLSQATRLHLDGETVLEASTPVDCVLDVAEGRLQVQTQEAATLRLGASTEPLALSVGQHTLSLANSAGLSRALPGLLAAQPAAADRPNRNRPRLYERVTEQSGEQAWALSLPDDQHPYSICLGQPGPDGQAALYVGTEEGALFRIDEGKIAWQFKAQDRINSIKVDDINNDGRAEVIAGSADHHVYVLDETGRELWRWETPFYMHKPTVEAVHVVDLGLPGGKAVIAGANSCHIHALSPTGQELWRWEVIHGVNDVTSADMNGDGVDEVLAVTEWWTWHCVDAAGKGLWKVWNVRPAYAPGANVVRAADVNGDGSPEMLCGGVDTCVYMFDKEGKRIWEFFTGEEISALECLDLNDDGVAEIVAGSMNGYVYGLDGDGKRLWQCGLDDEVNSIIPLRNGSDPRIAVATDSPRAVLLNAQGEIAGLVNTGHAIRRMSAHAANGAVALYTIAQAGSVAKHIV